MSTVLNHKFLSLQQGNQSPQDTIKWALESFTKISLSFSGAEDVILIDMVSKLGSDIQVFSLDTGRLHPETYRYLERVRNHYKIDLELLTPQNVPLQKLVRNKGLFSFYEEGHSECCRIRKVEPLKRKLGELDAWMTGVRRDQSPETRSKIPKASIDPTFSTTEHTLTKVNPLADWSSVDVWDYIHQNNVPFNPLHQRGFTSIGCEPCTRAILPNQHEREGRWWWEKRNGKECGLHAVTASTVG